MKISGDECEHARRNTMPRPLRQTRRLTAGTTLPSSRSTLLRRAHRPLPRRDPALVRRRPTKPATLASSTTGTTQWTRHRSRTMARRGQSSPLALACIRSFIVSSRREKEGEGGAPAEKSTVPENGRSTISSLRFCRHPTCFTCPSHLSSPSPSHSHPTNTPFSSSHSDGSHLTHSLHLISIVLVANPCFDLT